MLADGLVSTDYHPALETGQLGDLAHMLMEFTIIIGCQSVNYGGVVQCLDIHILLSPLRYVWSTASHMP